MNLTTFHGLIEKVRKETIGEPAWIPAKVSEYQNRSVQVVAVLKMVRAAHGVTALHLLCKNGLFIDFGAIMRCVRDAVTEVYFLLEKYTETSASVDRFVDLFFQTTIDGYQKKPGQFRQEKSKRQRFACSETGVLTKTHIR
jgi:hypothetical protein